jgi:hypothetical protein
VKIEKKGAIVKPVARPGAAGADPGTVDGFVNSPISALRFSALSLRRKLSTPHSTRFARLELGLFTKPSIWMTFYESGTVDRCRSFC